MYHEYTEKNPLNQAATGLIFVSTYIQRKHDFLSWQIFRKYMLLQKSFQPIVFSWGQSQLAAASWLRIPSEPLWKEFESCTTLAMEKKRNHGVARQKKISKGFELSERNSSWVALLHGNWTCSSITPHLSPGIIWRGKKLKPFSILVVATGKQYRVVSSTLHSR